MSPSEKVALLLGQLTLEEKCRMVAGRTAWIIEGCERLGIPEWAVSDGPVGARGKGSGPGLVVPGPSAVAATWNPELVHELGRALGVESIDRKADLLLAPTVNLHRSPRAGRHFESYSEDPELSSRIAVAYISGVQAEGVGACVKHYVANDQEFERFTINVEVDERSLREIYLPPFEAAVKEAGVWSVMGAYNFVNGQHACAHHEHLVDILKEEWGFEGFVVSDWGAVKDTVEPARHGLDLEMPGPGRFWGKGQLQAAVDRGVVDEELVDDKVTRILAFLEWRGRLGQETNHDEVSVERPEHRALVRRVAADSMVLLKNSAGLLPIPAGRSVALIGPGAADTALLGGGSASLRPHRSTNVLDAMTERPDITVAGHAVGVDMRRRAERVPAGWIGDDGVSVEVHDGIGFDGAVIESRTAEGTSHLWFGDSFPDGVDTLSVRLRFAMTPPDSGRYRVCALGFHHAQLFIDDELVADNDVAPFAAGLGLHGGGAEIDLEAGRPYEIRVEERPRGPGQWISQIDVGAELIQSDREQLLVEAEQVAAGADVAVVIVGSTSEWESEGGDRDSIDLPNGQEELIERVRAVNPDTVVVLNCGAPMNLPWLDTVPAALLAWYPGQEGGEAIADVLLGDSEPGGRMPTTWAVDERDTPSYLNYPGEDGMVRYAEGVFVGYRHYDAKAIDPRVAFGHGGSYTTFDWGPPSVSGAGTDLTVEVEVTNIGERIGSEVVQIYVAPHDHVVARPVKELGGFAKLTLQPGESATARIVLKNRSFARWDIGVHDWVVDPGSYDLVVAASAVDVRGSLTVECPS